jgi:hypothetical protein
MSELQRVPSLIGDIYESILDSSVWNGVFGDLVEFVGAQAGALLWKSHSRSTDVVHISGIKSPGLELYKERYAELDPATEPLLLREVGEVASTTELVSYSEYVKSRFYKEWVKPQGFVDSWQASLEKSATTFVHLIFWRNGKTDSDATRDRMRFIVPHLRRAVLISNLVDHDKADLLGDTLDGIAAGLFLVDPSEDPSCQYQRLCSWREGWYCARMVASWCPMMRAPSRSFTGCSTQSAGSRLLLERIPSRCR